MIHEIEPEAFETVRELFSPLRYRLHCAMVLERTKRGRVWVDDPAHPAAAFLAAPSLYFLAGAPSDGFCHALRRLITERIFVQDPLGHDRQAVRIICGPGAWGDVMGDILAGRAPIPTRRRFYVRDLAGEPPDLPVPEGCVLRPVDAAVLVGPIGAEGHRLAGMMERSHGSVERFLEHCFACVAIRGGEVVAWAPANNVSGRFCELGVRTHRSHRRRGLAAATVAGALRLAKSRGMVEASWHCDERNPGSVRVAEKLGFAFEREYTVYLAVGDEALHERVRARWERGELV